MKPKERGAKQRAKWHPDLGWETSKERWRKNYKGKPFTFTAPKTPAGYKEALEAFQEWKAKLEAQGDEAKPHASFYHACIQKRRHALRFLENEIMALEEPATIYFIDEWGTPEATHERLTKEIAFCVAELKKAKPAPPTLDGICIDPFQGAPALCRMFWDERLGIMNIVESWEAKPKPSELITHHLKAFMKAKEATLNDSTFIVYGHRLKGLEGLAEGKKLGELGPVLVEYHSRMLASIKAGTMKPETGRGNLRTAKGFCKWLYESEVIDALPRKIATLKIAPDHSAPNPPKIAECKLLLANASERSRMFMMLALNTGMTQKDIAYLRPHQVDWELGRITRKRTKTEKQAKAPVVTHQLWDETLRLMQMHRSKSKEYVFTNEDGKPLVWYKPDTKIRIDNIGVAYERLRTKLKKRGHAELPSFKQFRKLGPTLLKRNKYYKGFAKLFLSHAPKEIDEIHYAPESRALFRKACRWLGRKLGFITSKRVKSA